MIAILIIFAGIQLFISTVERLFSNKTSDLPGKLAIVITLISILGKAGISLYQYDIGKKF